MTIASDHSELMQENQDNAHRTHHPHAEDVQTIEAAAQRAAVGELLAHQRVRQMPAHEQTREETHHGKENLARHEIEYIEQRPPQQLQSFVAAQRQRTERADHGRGHRDDQRAAVAREVQFLGKECRAHLVQRDERGEGRQRQQRIEQQRHGIAQKGQRGEGLVEHVGQGDEDERRTAVGLHTYREGGGKDHQASQHGHNRVYRPYLHGRACQIGLAAEVGGIRTQTTHADAQRIERLAQGSEQNVAVHLAEIGLQQERYAALSPGQQARCGHDEQQQHEERRHHHLRSPLYAAPHAAGNDEVRGRQDQHRAEHGPQGIGLEGREIVSDVLRVAMQTTRERGVDVLQTPAGDHGIIARDEETRQHAQAAYEHPAAPAAQTAVGPRRVGARAAAYDELADHAGKSQHNDAGNVAHNEGGAAVLTRNVGKTPHVAQPYGRAGRGKHHAQLAPEIRSFL